MARDISISFAISAALTGGFKGAFQSAAASARNVASAVREMEKSSVGKLGASMAQQREKIKGLAGDIREAKATLAALQAKAQAAGGATGILERQIHQAQARVNSLNGAMSRSLNTWRDTVAQAATVGGSVRRLSQDYNDLSQNIERARRVQAGLNANRAQADALRNQRADLQGRLLSTAATTASVALPVKLAISAEDTFADLKKVMDAPEETLQQVFLDAQEMSNRTGKSFEDIVSIMTAGAQAGLGKTREELLGVADQAVKMSIAWGVSAEDAGKSLANWQASMGLTSKEAAHMGDVINALSNDMNAEAKDINAIFTRMGALMKGSGMAAQDIAALATAFKAAGAEVEVAGTAMKNFTKVMAAGSAGMTDKQLSLMRFIKIDPDELQKEFHSDAKKAISRVLEALKNEVNPEELNSVAMGIFGSESIGAISPLIDQIQQLNKANKVANSDVTGSVDEEYANRMKTTATAISQMTQSIRNLGVNAGKTLLPAVGAVAKGISSLAGTINGLVQRFPKLTSGVMIAGAGIAAFAMGSLALGLVINTVRSSINSVSGVFLKLAASQITATASTSGFSIVSWASAAASKAAGLGARFFAGGLRTILMATGVGAMLVGIGYGINLLIDNWETVTQVMSTAWGWITDTWSRLGNFFTNLGNNLIGIWPGIWSGVCGIATEAKESFISIWEDITGIFSSIGNKVVSLLSPIGEKLHSVFGGAYETVVSIWKGITGFYAGIWRGVWNITSTVWKTIFGLITSPVDTAIGVWQNVGDFFSGLWQGICDYTSSAVNAIVGVWNGAVEIFNSICANIYGAFQDFWQGVSYLASSAWNFVVGIWDGAIEYFTSFGQWIFGVFEGVWQNVVNAAQWAWNGISGIWQGAVEVFTSIGNSIFGVFDAVWQDVKGVATSAWDWIAGVWNGAVNFFSGIVEGIRGAFSSLFAWLEEKFAWVFKAIDLVGSAISSITGAVKGAWNAAFGDKKENVGQAAEQAKSEDSPAHAATSTPPPNTPNNTNANEALKTSVNNPEQKKQSLASFLAEEQERKKAEKASSKKSGGGGGGRKSSGSGGGSGGSGSSGKSGGPVTVVTLDGGQASTHTAFIPAKTFTAARSVNEPVAQAAKPNNVFSLSGVGSAISQGVQSGMGMIQNVFSSAKPGQSISGAVEKANASRPAVPQAPRLIAQKNKQRQQAKEQGASSISIDLKQNFDLITQDAEAAKKILESIKPDMEALIRKALAKINSDKTRTAYAQ